MGRKSRKKREIKQQLATENNAQTNQGEKTFKLKTDYDIPMFSYKSAIIILGAAVFATIAVPYLLGLIGVSNNLAVLIGNMTITPYAVSYTRYFVEGKEGYCKGFWRTFAICSIGLGLIVYFWLYRGLYI